MKEALPPGIGSREIDFYSAVLRNATPKRFAKKLLLRLLPNHLLEQLRVELQMLVVRLRSRNRRWRFQESRDLLLNVGAGDSGKDGWINLDAYSGAKINCVYDARKRLPFRKDSIKGIFTEHFFEHLDYTEEAPCFLRECHRVLRSGGTLRIIVPDAGRYLAAYTNGGWQELKRIRPLDEELRDHYYGWKYNTRMELINHVFRQGQQHKFAYDFETLEFLLQKNGFHDVRRQAYGISVTPELCIDSELRKPESLYVEAIKSPATV